MYLTTRSTADVSLKGKNSKCILLREVQRAVPSSSGLSVKLILKWLGSESWLVHQVVLAAGLPVNTLSDVA